MAEFFFRQSEIQNRKSKIGGDGSLFVALTICGAIAEAHQPKKVARIGYLSNGDPATQSTRAEAIRMALQERGYIEGQNIAFEYRYTEGKRDRAPELAAELVRLKVDIIVVAGGASWVLAAKNATKTIPIVMTGGPRGQLPACSILCGQNTKGSESRRPAGRAANEV
jgi:ABC-type uncharacterized transport system substrate-binding protein